MTDSTSKVSQELKDIFKETDELLPLFNPNADSDYFHFLVYGKAINIRNRFADIILDDIQEDGIPKSSDTDYRVKLEYVDGQYLSGRLAEELQAVNSKIGSHEGTQRLDVLSNLQTQTVLDYLKTQANKRNVVALARRLFAISVLMTPLIDKQEDAHWISWQGLWRLSEEQVESLKRKIRNDVEKLNYREG